MAFILRELETSMKLSERPSGSMTTALRPSSQTVSTGPVPIPRPFNSESALCKLPTHSVKRSFPPVVVRYDIEPRGVSESPHDLLVRGDDVRRTSEQSAIPIDRDLEVSHRATGKQDVDSLSP